MSMRAGCFAATVLFALGAATTSAATFTEQRAFARSAADDARNAGEPILAPVTVLLGKAV